MWLSIGETTLFVASFGPANAPALLGLGGWIGNWELWAEPFGILSQSWRTIAYDHRGSGASQCPVETLTFEALVDDLFAVLDACGVERCLLAAESAGALTALGATLRQPERFTGLVIVDGAYYRATPPEPDPFLLGLQHDYEGTLDWFVEACVPEPDCAAIKRWGRQILDRSSPEAAIALYRLASQVDLRNELHQIRQPTLILHGAQDSLVPLADAQWLADTLPNASLTILPDAGHVPTMTRPAEVAQAMLHFFPTR